MQSLMGRHLASIRMVALALCVARVQHALILLPHRQDTHAPRSNKLVWLHALVRRGVSISCCYYWLF